MVKSVSASKAKKSFARSPIREIPSDASLRDLAAAERYMRSKNRKVYHSAEEMLKALGID